MSAQIVTHLEQSVFRPKETIHGHVQWSLVQAPKSVRLQLFYYTEGKGTRDVILHDVETFDTPLGQDQRVFEFQLPPAPWSFSGKLLSVRWAMELIIDTSPVDELASFDLIVSPTSEEVDLYAHDCPPGPEHKKRWINVG